jgi:hypothetical protein
LTPPPDGGRVSRVAKGGENVDRRLVAALAAVVLGGLIAAPAAPAATTVGQLFQPTTNCSVNNTRLQTAAQSGTSYTIPSAGVLTAWRFQAGVLPLTGLKFKLAQPLGGALYRIVAETVAGPQVAAAVNTTAARVAVQPGQLIGIYYSEGYCGNFDSGVPAGDVYAARNDDQLAGTTNSYGSNPGGLIPVQATIEPDADKDGFGDETQDKCVGVAGPDRGCAKCKKKKKKKSSAGAAKKKKTCKKKKKK